MDQKLALEIMLAGESVLLTGPAGSGKTYLLNQFIKTAKAQKQSVAVTASTGLAASHLGGSTVHSWSGIGIKEALPKDFLRGLNPSRQAAIKKADTLIIDEISMLHDYRLDMINQVLKAVRGSSKPFGGVQVILCGDFFQLPPVNRGSSQMVNFAMQSQSWQELNPVICYLIEQHRSRDDNLLGVLNAIRSQDIKRKHLENLIGRTEETFPDSELTQLHTTNLDVDKINSQYLENLSSKVHEYTMKTTGKENYVAQLKNACLAPEKLVLKQDALVMFIRNSAEQRYVNGSLGRVIGFDENSDYPIIRLKNGKKVKAEPETWDMFDGDKKRASLTQLPLRLAWAITVHKSQGMTLDGARVDLRKAFVEGMGYVALSRVRSLRNLSLAGINKMALKVSQQARDADVSLRSRSAKDAKKFAHLLKKPNSRAFLVPKTPDKSTGWAEKLERMREQYPNAYRPWQEGDDERLLALFEQGSGIKRLCAEFGRHPGSIRARLKKHLGDDIKIKT